MSDALVDSRILQHYPGRFLDEIEQEMDIFRFLRALQARSVDAIEDLRKCYRERKIKETDISADQWQEMQKHDRWMVQLTHE